MFWRLLQSCSREEVWISKEMVANWQKCILRLWNLEMNVFYPRGNRADMFFGIQTLLKDVSSRQWCRACNHTLDVVFLIPATTTSCSAQSMTPCQREERVNTGCCQTCCLQLEWENDELSLPLASSDSHPKVDRNCELSISVDLTLNIKQVLLSSPRERQLNPGCDVSNIAFIVQLLQL